MSSFGRRHHLAIRMAPLFRSRPRSSTFYYSILLFILFFKTSVASSTLLIGALFSHQDGSSNGISSSSGGNGNSTLDLNEETVFKHAIYISNQYKLASINAPPNYPTLMHKIFHISKADQLKTINKVCHETSGNILALVGPQDETFRIYVKSMCKELDILHFDIEPNLQPSHSFNLYPSLDVLCLGFADLIKKFGWKHVAIFYDPKSSMRFVFFPFQWFKFSDVLIMTYFFFLNRSKKDSMSPGRTGSGHTKAWLDAQDSERRLPFDFARSNQAPHYKYHTRLAARRSSGRTQDGSPAGHDKLYISLHTDHSGCGNNEPGRLQVQSSQHNRI